MGPDKGDALSPLPDFFRIRLALALWPVQPSLNCPPVPILFPLPPPVHPFIHPPTRSALEALYPHVLSLTPAPSRLSVSVLLSYPINPPLDSLSTWKPPSWTPS